MTQEYIGDFLASEAKGEDATHPLSGYFKTALYYSVEKMVHKICHNFKTSIDDSEGDLSQSCIMYLFSVIGNFDSRRGKFTTFAYWVCRNHLCGLYKSSKKRRDVFITSSDLADANTKEAVEAFHQPHPVASDIADTISIIMKKFPKSKKMISEIFGNPSEINSENIPSSLNLQGTRRFSTKARREFVRKYALPVFQRRFGYVYA